MLTGLASAYTHDIAITTGISQWLIDLGTKNVVGIPRITVVAVITSVIAHERQELQRRESLYRHGLLPLDVAGKDVVLVDDGMATGASMLVAVQALRGLGPRSITVGVPVSSSEALRLLRPHVDDWASVITPPALYGVGMWYEDFSQTADEEVGRLLAESRHQPGVAA